MRGPHRIPLEQRFWDQSIPEPNSGCWLWLGPLRRSGYGHFKIGSRTDSTRKNVSAHRLAYTLTHGPIVDDLHVLHKCDNKACVNPEHLYVGTHFDNMRDVWKRGRKTSLGVSGEKNPFSVLTELQVREIKTSAASGAALAVKFSVSPSAVSCIRAGRTWRHINV